MCIYEYKNYRVERSGKLYFVVELTGMAYRICFKSHKRKDCVMWVLNE